MSISELATLRARIAALRAVDPADAQSVAERDALIDRLMAVSEQLDAVIDAIPYAVAVRDLAGRYVLANAAMPENSGLGIDAGDFLGKTFTELQPAGGTSAHVRKFEQVLRTGEAVRDHQFESAVTPGRWRNMSAIPLHDASGEMTAVLSVGRDVTERVRDVEGVRESEIQFRELAELSPDAMVIQVNGKVRFVNASACRMLGAASDTALLGVDSLPLAAPEWREHVLQRRQQAETDGVRVPFGETRHLRLDGSSFPSEVIAGPITWEGEQGTVNIIQDITARKAAEDAVRRSNLRMTTLIRNLPGIAYRMQFELAGDGQAIRPAVDFVSDACFELLGYPPDELLGSPGLTRIVHPDDFAPDASYTARHLNAEQVESRMRLRCSDGSWRWMLRRSRRSDHTGNTITVEGLLVDIDAQVRAEEALADRTRLLQTVIDTVPAAGITMRDREDRCVLVNAAAAEFFKLGVSSEALIGKRVTELLPMRASSVPQDDRARVLATGKAILGTEYESKISPGTWRVVNTAPVLDANGAIEGVVQVNLDISERKAAERALLRHRDSLEEMVQARTRELSEQIAERERAEAALARNERLAAIGQVAATVSHELRNPLGTINTSLYLLDNETPDPTPQWRRTRERIQRSINRCVRIIEEMLAYARDHAVECRPADVDSWTRELLDELEVPDDVVLSQRLESGARASIDRDRLAQAVLNVAQNACQAASQRLPGPPGAQVSVTTVRVADEVHIDIMDNGPGIDAANLERIFEPLFSTKSFGVGLGLPLVKRLLEEHGGRVVVDTSQAGTTFSLRLPVVPDRG